MNYIRTLLVAVAVMMTALTARADETITVSSTAADIAENLDLKAVATLFGEVNNLEEFEQELNSEERHLNNLDLNGDGVVDYLRVVEIGEGNNRLIVLQAVLAKDIYQDVASIYVEKRADQTVAVQVVGDEYLYGSNYVIEPVYIYRPVIYDWFWSPYWVSWSSPYHWGYYPNHYTCYSPWYWNDYYYHIHTYHYHHPYCSFHYAHIPHYGIDGLRHSDRGRHVVRNDWADAHPEHHFTVRASQRGVTASNMRQMSVRPAASADGLRRTTTANRPAPTASGGTHTRPSASASRADVNPSSRRYEAATATSRTYGSSNLRHSTSSASASTSRTPSAATDVTAPAGASRHSAASTSSASNRSTSSVRSSATTQSNTSTSSRPITPSATDTRSSGWRAVGSSSTATTRSSVTRSGNGNGTRGVGNMPSASSPRPSVSGSSSSVRSSSSSSSMRSSSSPSSSRGTSPSGGASTRRSR